MTKLRVRFAKHGKIRFTSHRDVARIWERDLRRVGFPVAYTEGFSPRPKLSFGLALSTGYESRGEYLDVAVREGADDVAPEAFATLVAPGLPVGIEVQAVEALDRGADSLQQAVTSCTWHIDVSGRRRVGEADGVADAAGVAEALAAALAAPELTLTRERKGKAVTEDVRPAILAARVLAPEGDGGGNTPARIEVELATQPRALRPEELVTVVAGDAWRTERVTRINQWTLVGGARQEVIPLLPAATPPPHAEARAS